MNSEIQKNLSNEQLIRLYSADEFKFALSMGCQQCPHLDICGGLHVKGPLFDCLDFCCGNMEHCTLTCRNNSKKFVAQIREIGGFEFAKKTPGRKTITKTPSGVWPLVYHGYSRAEPLAHDFVALPFSSLLNYKNVRLKYNNSHDLRKAFQLDSKTKIIISGVDHDRRIENWWSFGEKKRAILIQQLQELDIHLITSPNYSLLLDVPRSNDLHAMKRIEITYSEFTESGIPCALHINGRTAHDFRRWGLFLKEHAEIALISYEFGTGAGRIGRLNFHLKQLSLVVETAGRALDIVARGNVKILSPLKDIFRNVTYLETDSFVRTMKRQRAYINNNLALRWRSEHTEKGTPIDDLLYGNINLIKPYLQSKT